MTDVLLVDVTCRGLRVAQRARLIESGPTAGFLELETPLPVGTRVGIQPEGGALREARVTGVVELEAGGKVTPGMRVDWTPAKAAEESAPAIELTSSDAIAEAPADNDPTADGESAAAGSDDGPSEGNGRRKRRKRGGRA